MKILALETSTEYCSVALWRDGMVNERFELVGQKHSETLMPILDGLLKDENLKLAQLDGIAYGAGPGSFTGVRIACGVTQGLAFGANLPVVGVCTLQALAEASGKAKVIAALDARMGEIYHAAYEKNNGVWTTTSEPCLCKAQDAPIVSGVDWFGVGSGFAVFANEFGQRYVGQLSGVDSEAVPRAASIASLAVVQFAQGLGMDVALAQPFYLRDKVALKTHEREQLAREKNGLNV